MSRVSLALAPSVFSVPPCWPIAWPSPLNSTTAGSAGARSVTGGSVPAATADSKNGVSASAILGAAIAVGSGLASAGLNPERILCRGWHESSREWDEDRRHACTTTP